LCTFESFVFKFFDIERNLSCPNHPPLANPNANAAASPGNANALRHGFYSKYFTETEMKSLDG